jgi:hypothetical protein
MRTIQSQISIIHIDSQVPVSSAMQRDAAEDSFSVVSTAVDDTAMSVDLGDVTNPRQVFIKLTSVTDDGVVQIGFSDTVFPMELALPEEFVLLSLADGTPPTVYLKSTTTAQVVIAVLPL